MTMIVGFKVLLLLQFRFPRACIFLHGWPKYYTTAYQMRDGGIIDTFNIFRVFKVARIFDKNLEHDAYVVK